MVYSGGHQAEKAPSRQQTKKGPQQTGKRPSTDNMIDNRQKAPTRQHEKKNLQHTTG